MRFALTTLALAALAAPALAAPIQFANFTENDANKPVSFTNLGGIGATLSGTAIPVDFHFTTPTGLSSVDRPAHMSLFPVGAFSTLTPATIFAGFAIQPMQAMPNEVVITEDATGKNLLTVMYTGNLAGQYNGFDAQVAASDSNSQQVVFTSDYLTFTQPGNSFQLDLSAMQWPLGTGPGGFLNSFNADVLGAFTANAQVPEPGMIGLAVMGLVGLSGVRRRSR